MFYTGYVYKWVFFLKKRIFTLFFFKSKQRPSRRCTNFKSEITYSFCLYVVITLCASWADIVMYSRKGRWNSCNGLFLLLYICSIFFFVQICIISKELSLSLSPLNSFDPREDTFRHTNRDHCLRPGQKSEEKMNRFIKHIVELVRSINKIKLDMHKPALNLWLT